VLRHRRGPPLERTLKSPADTRDVALDPKGRFLATAPPNTLTRGSVYLFDLAAPRTAEPMPLLGDERPGNTGMWFSPDGFWLALGIGRGFVLWNVAGAHSTVVGREKPPYVQVALRGMEISSPLLTRAP
jgi:hypothetical protein